VFRDPDVPRRLRESVPDDARRTQALARLARDHDPEIAARARSFAAADLVGNLAINR
jgi:hypothetical protein